MYFVHQAYFAWVTKVMISVEVCRTAMAGRNTQAGSRCQGSGKGLGEEELLQCLDGAVFCFRICNWAFLTCKGELLLLSLTLTVLFLCSWSLTLLTSVHLGASCLLAAAVTMCMNILPRCIGRVCGKIDEVMLPTPTSTYETIKLLLGSRMKYSKQCLLTNTCTVTWC